MCNDFGNRIPYDEFCGRSAKSVLRCAGQQHPRTSNGVMISGRPSPRRSFGAAMMVSSSFNCGGVFRRAGPKQRPSLARSHAVGSRAAPRVARRVFGVSRFPRRRPVRRVRCLGKAHSIYAGVLGGIEGMVKSFAAELRPVRVNGVCAGAVDTELWHRLPEAERLAMFERIGARLPVGRVGKPEDIAEAYLYLMKTGFSTGETVVVDGGALQAP